jgi:enamine deaminase RidA (YjgF/YER057c/UK114 family)
MNIKRLGDPSEISDAVICGSIVYLAGAVAEDPVSPSVYEQTKNVLQQIDDLLKQAGTDKTKLLKANVYLADIKTFDDMHRAWKEWVPKGHAPARATVEARLVHHPKWGVEIMCEALIG